MTDFTYGFRLLAILTAISAAFTCNAGGADVPLLVCDEPHVNIGETRTVNQEHRFRLRNASGAPLEITATHKACGCVKREFSKYQLAPGDTTELTLEFPIRTKPGAVGDFVERIEIYVNNQHESPAAVISVSGRLVPVAYRLRDGIHIEAPLGQSDFRGHLDVFLNKGRGVQIESIETTGPLPVVARISKREETLNEGEEKAVLEVSGTLPKDVVLPATATVLLKLNSDVMPEMSIPVVLYRKETRRARFSPELLAFGVAAQGATVKRVVTIELPKSGKYVVDKAEAAGAGVTVAIEESPKVPHVVKLRCELEPSSPGKIERELLVTVLSPEGVPDVYKIPVSGFVKPATAQIDRAAQRTTASHPATKGE